MKKQALRKHGLEGGEEDDEVLPVEKSQRQFFNSNRSVISFNYSKYSRNSKPFIMHPIEDEEGENEDDES